MSNIEKQDREAGRDSSSIKNIEALQSEAANSTGSVNNICEDSFQKLYSKELDIDEGKCFFFDIDLIFQTTRRRGAAHPPRAQRFRDSLHFEGAVRPSAELAPEGADAPRPTDVLEERHGPISDSVHDA